jgi:hypothetical protein
MRPKDIQELRSIRLTLGGVLLSNQYCKLSNPKIPARLLRNCFSRLCSNRIKHPKTAYCFQGVCSKILILTCLVQFLYILNDHNVTNNEYYKIARRCPVSLWRKILLYFYFSSTNSLLIHVKCQQKCN